MVTSHNYGLHNNNVCVTKERWIKDIELGYNNLYNNYEKLCTRCKYCVRRKGFFPKCQLPKCQTPRMSTPRMSTSQMSAPKMSTPKMSTSQMSAPKMSTPKILHLFVWQVMIICQTVPHTLSLINIKEVLWPWSLITQQNHWVQICVAS